MYVLHFDNGTVPGGVAVGYDSQIKAIEAGTVLIATDDLITDDYTDFFISKCAIKEFKQTLYYSNKGITVYIDQVIGNYYTHCVHNLEDGSDEYCSSYAEAIIAAKNRTIHLLQGEDQETINNQLDDLDKYQSNGFVAIVPILKIDE